ncbi:GntR family transcriptional regulator [Victivallis lenta]|uniref:GntR family transcriptional regulator n=1 Tax=Victivallis lenta TaxID=2606640 RepID=UPI000D0262BB|nr:GntR family transcriptional regulator [Victivallis lenta]AVM43637.1 hypothetical protein C5Q97_02545 [Victivallales bacterium CCUG 44730]
MGSLPKYEELARRITGDIQNGIYPDGTPLPSEAELAAQAGVSRVTVRQALVQLSRLGIIVKQQGRRSVVNVAAVPERTRTLRFAWISRDPFAGATPVYLEIFNTLQRMMMRINANLVFMPMIDPREEDWVLSVLDSFDGILLAGVRSATIIPALDRRLRAMPNVIEIDDIGDSPAACTICTDNYLAGCMAADYLIDRNRNVIACVSGNCTVYRGFHDRTRGMIDRFAERKKPLVLFNSEDENIATEAYGAALLKLLEEQPQLDTVWHVVDFTAIQVRRRLEEVAPREPGFYRSAGVDGMASVLKDEKFHVSLRHPVEEIADRVFRTMLDFTAGKFPAQPVQLIEPLLLPWSFASEDSVVNAG